MKSIRKVENSKTDIYLQAFERLERKIDKLEMQSNLDKEYLSMAEAQRYLMCSRSMIYKLIEAGKIHPVKSANKRVYYQTSELKAYVEGHTLDFDQKKATV